MSFTTMLKSMQIDITFDKNPFSKAFRPLLECETRYMVLYGGAGSGKSFFVGQRYIYRMLTDRINLLVVRNTGRTNRDSTFALFKRIINQWGLGKEFNINQSDLRISCRNGNEIIFSGLDDVEKLKSVTFQNGDLTDIWIEEASEIQESDFNQLDVRLRGKGQHKQIVLSFNPIIITHWLKRRFIDVSSEDITVHHSTYLDNEHLDDGYKKLLESYKDTDPYYYKVYCLGEWGSVNDSIFDTNAIQNRLPLCPEPIKRGHFDYDRDCLNARWVDDSSSYIKVYEEPKNGSQYVIGGDTASGVGSDYCVAQVLDEKGNQVCVLHAKMDTDLFAKQVYCLGHYYNYALVSIEVNYDLYPIKKLEDLGYTNQYIREQQDTFTGGIKKAFGFRTDAYTRPRILTSLIEIVREHIELFNDRATLEEMLTFVRNDKGKASAQEGSHDDLVMAVAIGHNAISQLRPNIKYEHKISEEEEFFDYR